MDGYHWSRKDDIAAVRVVATGAEGTRELSAGDPVVSEAGASGLGVFCPVDSLGTLEILCEEDRLEFAVPSAGERAGWGLLMQCAATVDPPVERAAERSVTFLHNAFTYHVDVTSGRIQAPDGPNEKRILILPASGKIVLNLTNRKGLDGGPEP